jgi:enhancing lycopene biosynthesis protein 2
MANGKRVGVLLSGCGYLDGAEIHEATCTLLSLDRRGARLVAAAPDRPQHHVVDHLSGEPQAGETRSVLREAARLVRGQIRPLAGLEAAELDALILPGGFGAAKNLCTFAVDGARMTVDRDVERLIRELRAAGKPMGFICIAPVIAARVLGGAGVTVTIGHDQGTAAAIRSWGAVHVDREVEEIALDERLKVVSTPAYMLGPWIAPVAAGIDRLVEAVLEMA